MSSYENKFYCLVTEMAYINQVFFLRSLPFDERVKKLQQIPRDEIYQMQLFFWDKEHEELITYYGKAESAAIDLTVRLVSITEAESLLK